ncbi:MAG: hypothetical protein OXQ94_18070 [Gemmatimonadota bacterium]|nr:hypothetical protein [Gemmatimonadota bacterium]MDE2873582.1 hypothetical protein [Gemmatimonadota bacterium]
MRTRGSASLFLPTLVLAGCGLLGPEYLEVREVTVGPTLARCYGVGPQSCMVVDGDLFYDGIEGFTWEALSEVSSRTRAAGTEEVITVDRHRVPCDDGHPGYCKVVNGAPFRGEIVGFRPRHEDSYRLRVERFDMFPEGVTGAPHVPAYGYRRLETLERTPGG